MGQNVELPTTIEASILLGRARQATIDSKDADAVVAALRLIDEAREMLIGLLDRESGNELYVGIGMIKYLQELPDLPETELPRIPGLHHDTQKRMIRKAKEGGCAIYVDDRQEAIALFRAGFGIVETEIGGLPAWIVSWEKL